MSACAGHGTTHIWHSFVSCLCDSGWRGDDCSLPACNPPCSNGTSCIALNQCECMPGVMCTEHTCPSGCSGNGNCVDGTCECNLLWAGPACAEPACINNCSGRGHCQHALAIGCSIAAACPRACSGQGECLSDGRCECLAGWTGDACDRLECPLECGIHATCTSGQCVCNSGWLGEQCSEPAPVCLDTACSWPHGYCSNNGTSCACAPGWTGTECGDPECWDGCSGHGSCTEAGRCFCMGGWSGERCDVPPCPGEPPCSRHGRCVAPSPSNTHTPTCECFSGYVGVACERLEGCAAGCGAHGHCVRGACECDAGWTGIRCEVRSCAEGCSDHGRCVDGACECFSGWAGSSCDVSKCPNACSSHGHCIGVSCQCAGGWRGDDCAESIGCPEGCWASLGHGLCVVGGDGGVTCACAEGFFGEGCGRAAPFLDVAVSAITERTLGGPVCSATTQCGLYGTCHPSGTCVCEPGWHGDACDLRACVPSDWRSDLHACGAHGTCVDGFCRCDAGFSSVSARGVACQRECPTDCSAPYGVCGDAFCLCVRGRRGADCSGVLCPNGCSTRGTCGANGMCLCHAGFGGDDCSARFCTSNCSSHGSCIVVVRSQGVDIGARTSDNPVTVAAPTFSTCTCDLGWTGERCEIPACPKRCSNRGACVDGACKCWSGWKGVDCADRHCPRDPRASEPDDECGGYAHGECDRASGRCRCLLGWTGMACERRACLGTPSACSGHGVCLVDARFRIATCACESPYSGVACEAAACPRNCTDHGWCLQPPNRNAGQCTCEPGWRGVDCGQRACEPGCYMHGDCSTDGRCLCHAGWGGPACAEPACPGGSFGRLLFPTEATLMLNVPTTAAVDLRRGCHPIHGRCDPRLRVCVCDDGWTGADCSEPTCPSDCYGRGACIAGVCACESFRAGRACEVTMLCPGGCSGHGTCDDLSGGCLCSPGWTGVLCEHATCVRRELLSPAHGRCLHGDYECVDDKSNSSGGDAARDESVDGDVSVHGGVGIEPTSGSEQASERDFGARVVPHEGAQHSGGSVVSSGVHEQGHHSGLIGSLCRAALTCMHGCNGHGTCAAPRGPCLCEVGWSGEWCQHRVCTHICGPRGWCEDGQCVCDAGWAGPLCLQLECVGTGTPHCGAHGDCVQPEARFEQLGEGGRCQCHHGWAGVGCSVPAAAPLPQ